VKMPRQHREARLLALRKIVGVEKDGLD